MKIIVAKDYDQISKIASLIIAKAINEKPNLVLGLATGSTPLGTYRELIRLYREQALDFSGVATFNLDEYYGLSPDNKQSYAFFMRENLFKHVNINPVNTHIPNGIAVNIDDECERYDLLIEKNGGIDLQILGIGSNGHIGFNEPNEELKINTHLIKLAENTIKDNGRFFGSKGEVPKFAITMGIGAIMKAKKVLLLASGANKAEIISKIINGAYTTKIPASVLQVHVDVTILVDEVIMNHPVNQLLVANQKTNGITMLGGKVH